MTEPAITVDMALATHDGAARGALFDPAVLASLGLEAATSAAAIERTRGSGPMAFLELPWAYSASEGPTVFGTTLHGTLELVDKIASEILSSDGQFVHVGIGGSALGAMVLVNALAPRAIVGRDRRIYVTDNIDPDGMNDILAELDSRRLYANVVSKSGGTVESIAVFSVLWRMLQTQSGLPADKLRGRVFVTTNPVAGALAEVAHSEGFCLLPLPDAVHGRFSVFSLMGLLTAAVAGVDVRTLLAGARAADWDTRSSDPVTNPVLQLAALHVAALRSGVVSNLVLLPYSDRLRLIGDWYSQLVAESLGKDGQGLTPVKALGVTDQHSQLQLYNDGPKDKLVTLFSIREHQASVQIPPSISETESYSYLAGKSFAELLDAERRGTEVSLYRHGVPSCRIELQRLDAYTLGYLLTVLEKCVCVIGRMAGVDAFNQPGVEESKDYARALLGHSGSNYEALRQDAGELVSQRQSRRRR